MGMGLLGPNSIIVVYMDPLGKYTQFNYFVRPRQSPEPLNPPKPKISSAI